MRGKTGERPTLAIGPANYAGQSAAWVTAYREVSGAKAVSFGYRNSSSRFGFETDRKIGRLRRFGWPSMGEMESLAKEVDCVAVDGFVPLGGVSRFTSLRREIGKVQDAGAKVMLISHGTDTRNPRSHMERLEYSYFRESPSAYVSRCEAESRYNRSLPGLLNIPLLVSTPDLLIDNPGAQWLPVVVRSDIWSDAPSPFAHDTIRVLHIPSRTKPPIKGTGHIDPVLSKLAEEGLIDYVRAESVSHFEMPNLVKSADVVVDQIQTGSYGVAAVEAMAAQRLVVGNVSPDVRAIINDEVPIVDSSPANLESVIRLIAAERSDFAAIAAVGPGYVSKYHSGRRSGEVLLSTLQEL